MRFGRSPIKLSALSKSLRGLTGRPIPMAMGRDGIAGRLLLKQRVLPLAV